MKFLNVFCVILYLHNGVSMPQQSNERDLLYEQSRKNKSPLNTEYNPNHGVTNINGQKQKQLDESLQTPLKDSPHIQLDKSPQLQRKELLFKPEYATKGLPNGYLSPIDNKHSTHSAHSPDETILFQHNLGNGHNINIQKEITKDGLYQSDGIPETLKSDSIQSMPTGDSFPKTKTIFNKEFIFPLQNRHQPVNKKESISKSEYNVNLSSEKIRVTPNTKPEIKTTAFPSFYQNNDHTNWNNKVTGNYQNQANGFAVQNPSEVMLSREILQNSESIDSRNLQKEISEDKLYQPDIRTELFETDKIRPQSRGGDFIQTNTLHSKFLYPLLNQQEREFSKVSNTPIQSANNINLPKDTLRELSLLHPKMATTTFSSFYQNDANLNNKNQESRKLESPIKLEALISGQTSGQNLLYEQRSKNDNFQTGSSKSPINTEFSRNINLVRPTPLLESSNTQSKDSLLRSQYVTSRPKDTSSSLNNNKRGTFFARSSSEKLVPHKLRSNLANRDRANLPKQITDESYQPNKRTETLQVDNIQFASLGGSFPETETKTVNDKPLLFPLLNPHQSVINKMSSPDLEYINNMHLPREKIQTPSTIQPGITTPSIPRSDVDNLNWRNKETGSYQNQASGKLELLSKPEGNFDFHHILNNIKRQYDLHAHTNQAKAYTVIRSDGKVEHFDNLETINAKHPKYITITSRDLETYTQGDKSLIPTSLIQSFKNFNVKKENPSGMSSIKVSQPTDALINLERKAEVFNKPQELINVDFKNNKLISTLTPSSLTKKVETPTTKVMKQNTTEKLQSLNDQSSISTLNQSKNEFKNVSTPVIREHITENLSTKNSTYQINGPDDNITNNVQNDTIVPPYFSEPTTTKENCVNNKNCSVKEFVSPNKTESMLGTSNSTALENQDDTKTYPRTNPPPALDNLNHSVVWFQADEDFWEKLINDSQNVFYFMFMPSIPNIEKETKTTIYPNGTIVEEIIERVGDEDGSPTISKKTKVVHARDTDTNTNG